MLFTNKTVRRIACFRRESTKISARSQQLVGISRVSGFLVGIMNKTISRVLQTQGHNFTDKRWFINKILRRIVCFQRKYKKNRLARNHIHFLQFPTCRYKSSLIRPSWYHQHTWTNTRIYCTDKNIYQQNTKKNRMFPTPNTKISARSAHSQSVICFQLGIIIKKGHAINCPWKTGDSAPSTPDKGSVRNFNGRILLLTIKSQALICSKHKSFRGLCPLGTRQGP